MHQPEIHVVDHFCLFHFVQQCLCSATLDAPATAERVVGQEGRLKSE